MRNHWATGEMCAVVIMGALSVRLVVAAAVDDKLPDEAKTALLKANALELVRLWPFEENDQKPGKDYFHGYEVTNRVTLKGEDARKLSGAVVQGIADGGDKALCFEPHHGIRAVYDGKVYDFVICFQCKQIICYGPEGGVVACIGTSNSPEKTLDRLIAPSAKPAKDKDGK